MHRITQENFFNFTPATGEVRAALKRTPPCYKGTFKLCYYRPALKMLHFAILPSGNRRARRTRLSCRGIGLRRTRGYGSHQFPNHPMVLSAPIPQAFSVEFFREQVQGIQLSALLRFLIGKRMGACSTTVRFAHRGIGGIFLPPRCRHPTSPQLHVGLSGWWVSKIKRCHSFWKYAICGQVAVCCRCGQRQFDLPGHWHCARFLYNAADHRGGDACVPAAAVGTGSTA
jgi:hypothetical protein